MVFSEYGGGGPVDVAPRLMLMPIAVRMLMPITSTFGVMGVFPGVCTGRDIFARKLEIEIGRGILWIDD